MNDQATEKGRHKLFGKHKETVLFMLDVLLNIVIIAALVYIIRSYLISPFQVYGPSMCDTLNFINNKCEHAYGEYIIVNKVGYQNFLGWKVGEPQRGDVVIFHPPKNSGEFFIKRIIGLPGETVELKNGEVYVKNSAHPQGVKLEEPYLNATNKGNTRPYRPDNTVFEIPEGSYFVMGDNRIASSDSRSCFKENITSGDCGQNGNTPYIKPSSIEGKAWLVLWPIANLEIVKSANYQI